MNKFFIAMGKEATNIFLIIMDFVMQIIQVISSVLMLEWMYQQIEKSMLRK